MKNSFIKDDVSYFFWLMTSNHQLAIETSCLGRRTFDDT